MQIRWADTAPSTRQMRFDQEVALGFRGSEPHWRLVERIREYAHGLHRIDLLRWEAGRWVKINALRLEGRCTAEDAVTIAEAVTAAAEHALYPANEGAKHRALLRRRVGVERERRVSTFFVDSEAERVRSIKANRAVRRRLARTFQGKLRAGAELEAYEASWPARLACWQEVNDRQYVQEPEPQILMLHDLVQLAAEITVIRQLLLATAASGTDAQAARKAASSARALASWLRECEAVVSALLSSSAAARPNISRSG